MFTLVFNILQIRYKNLFPFVHFIYKLYIVFFLNALRYIWIPKSTKEKKQKKN